VIVLDRDLPVVHRLCRAVAGYGPRLLVEPEVLPAELALQHF
jgi:hypothetical protein